MTFGNLWKVLVVILLYAETAMATSFWPYQEQCIAAPNGRFYVVVKRKDGGKPYGPVSLTIVESRTGAAPMRSAVAGEASGDLDAIRDPGIRVRDGDVVHSRVVLEQPPRRILVASSGKSIVTLDVYGFNNLGADKGKNDVVIYSIKGEVVHRKGRDALFDETARLYFRYGDGVVSWFEHAWLDEKRDELVIVTPSEKGYAPTRALLSVGLTSGNVRQANTGLIDRAISERNPGALSEALELAREMRLDGSKSSWPGIVDDEKLALGHRLRAAVLLASFGDRRGTALSSKTALLAAEDRDGPPKPERAGEVYYAIKHLPELLGRDALPILKKTIQKNSRAYSFAHVDAFKSLGADAVPTLVSVLEDDDNFDAQLEAATCLGSIGPDAEKAVPALAKALHKKASRPEGVLVLRLNTHAAWALEHIGERAKAAVPDLEQLARDDDEDVRRSALTALARIRGETRRP